MTPRYAKYERSIGSTDSVLVKEILESIDDQQRQVLVESQWTRSKAQHTPVITGDLQKREDNSEYRLLVFPDFLSLTVGQFRELVSCTRPYWADGKFSMSEFLEESSKVVS